MMTSTSTSTPQQRAGGGGRFVRPSIPSFGGFFSPSGIFSLILAALVIYLGYFWLERRVVVHQGQVLVLIKKDGSRSLPGDQVVVPRPPARDDQVAYAAWEKEYGNCNGILEQVYSEGTYFGFSPFDYERQVVDIGNA